ncbi:MAG: hypothetical protein LBM99_05380, partial [Bacillales bacterium]|nr:hypothetical protein [Bacillales bacterium]
MNIIEKTKYYLKEINNLLNSKEKKEKQLPANAYFIDEQTILISNPLQSNARHPYQVNGLTLWVYASGYISLNKSTFYYILPANDGNEPFVSFTAGIKKNNAFTPLSLLPNLQINTNKHFTIFTNNETLFFTIYQDVAFMVSLRLSQDSSFLISLVALNLTSNKKTIYLSSYINPLFKHETAESIETKWFKKGLYHNNTFSFFSHEDISRGQRLYNYGLIKRKHFDKVEVVYNTTSKHDYKGINTQLHHSYSLKEGKFKENRELTIFDDTAILGDYNHYILNESIVLGYRIQYYNNEKDYQLALKTDNIPLEVNNKLNDFDIHFNDIENKSPYIFNSFIKQVINQVDYSAYSTNSGTIFLGVRDVCQMLETSLLWNKKETRKKILEVFSFIDPSGQVPRQYSLPFDDLNAKMDLREFIDQGLWLINLIYEYLAYSNDYS